MKVVWSFFLVISAVQFASTQVLERNMQNLLEVLLRSMTKEAVENAYYNTFQNRNSRIENNPT